MKKLLLAVLLCFTVTQAHALDLGLNLGFSKNVASVSGSAALEIPIGTAFTAVGDSMTYGDFRGKSWAVWLNQKLDGALYYPTTYNRGTASAYGGNAGVSGETSAQIAARASTFNSHNGIYIILLGENDSAAVTAAAQQANWETIFTELSGAKQIYVIPFAETAAVYASSTIQTRNATVLAWLRGDALSTYSNLTILPDSVWDNIQIHDGLGGAGADSQDGTHPDNVGSWKLGANIGAYLLGQLETDNVLTTSWDDYNASKNGQLLNAGTGSHGAPAVAGIDSTKALVAYTKTATNVGDLACTILSRDGVVLTEEGSVDVTTSQTIQQKPAVLRMSDTRALIGYINDTGATDRWEVSLIDVSGTTPSVLDTAQESTLTANSNTPALTALSDSLAIMQGNNKVFAVSVSGDTLSIGSPVGTIGGDHGAITTLDATSFAVAEGNQLYYYSISGTTITEGANIVYNTAGVSGVQNVVAVSDTEVIVVYEEDDVDNKVYAKPITWGGSSWSAGTQVEVYDGNILTLENKWAWSLENRQIMVMFQDNTQTMAHQFIITSDVSHALTVGAEHRPFGDDIQADHPTGDMFPSTDALAISVFQNESSSKQIGAMVLHSVTGLDSWMDALTNIYPADFSGTGGTYGAGITGSLATGLYAAAVNTSGLTITLSKGTLPDGDDSQIIEITGTAPAGTVYMYVREVVNPGGYDTDGGILSIQDLKITATDGVSAPVGLMAPEFGGAYAKQNFLSYNGSADGGIPFAFAGVAVNQPETQSGTMSFWNSDDRIRLEPSTTVDVRIEYNKKQFDITDEGL